MDYDKVVLMMSSCRTETLVAQNENAKIKIIYGKGYIKAR